MKPNSNDRLYVKYTGKKAEELCRKISDSRRRLQEGANMLRDRFKAAQVRIKNDFLLTGQMLLNSPGKRQGLKVATKPQNGMYAAEINTRTKAGVRLAEELKTYCLEEHPSDLLVNAYDAYRAVPVEDPGSRTGRSLAVSVAYADPAGKFVLLNMPVSPDEPYQLEQGGEYITPAEFTELCNAYAKAQ